MDNYMQYTNPYLSPQSTAPSSGVNVNISNPSTSSTPSFNSLFSNALLQPKHHVQQVNDERDIYQLAMGIDSSDFVLHATKPLIYFVATDSSGNKTSIIPFDIQKHEVEPEPTIQDVKEIETRLENKFNSF